MYQERIKKVLAAMEEMGLEQMLVSNPNSIWYLTGYYVFPYERMLALYLRRTAITPCFSTACSRSRKRIAGKSGSLIPMTV